ncbi:hypothetical protein KIM372_13140 [Bombiscardovia nodaiensis]|uniref:PD-(D/E)XK endonuclease-like domain-containing protein n=1 Tax=Bombiscardovia nodaiensis TaxID=2932181 RepID=A0ABM8B945_9BIFI|nr:hypothetical protein KIM372_13140 [Bombiscardovia nodaiensis]
MTLTSLEDEVFGDLRRQTGFVDDEAASSPSDSDQSTVIDPQAVSAAPAIPDYLTQPEEYGQRQHKDERRLAYVALTRARHDLLVTFSAQPNNANPALLMPPQEAAAAKSARGAAGGRGKGPGQSQEAEGQGPREAILDSASNFWKELHAYFASEATRVDAGQAWQAQELATTQPELLLPQGYFLGERAVAYEQAVTSQALEEAPALQEADRGQASGIWPIALSSQVEEALALSARQTAQSVQVSAQDLQELEQADDSLYAHAERILKVGTGRLGVQGDLLVRDSQALQAVGAQVQAQGAQSVTAIQARSGGMDERSQRRYWRSVVRPLPQVASPAAEAGTRFHAWAASFLLPQIPADSGLVDSSPSGEPVQSYADLEASEQMSQSELAGDAFSQSEQALSAPSGLCDDQLAERTRMVADLEANLQQPVQDPERSVAAGQSRGKARESTPASSSEQESRLLLWQERLAQSDWAQRSPVWVERPIVAAIAGQIVKGKLDAVFAGGLNPADQSKSFTIVDWKTGHKPLSQQERERKLAQLDLYRLLLSRKENKPLASIDACLYYVNEDDSSQRTIPAGHKSQSEIEAQVRAGLPEQSDND